MNAAIRFLGRVHFTMILLFAGMLIMAVGTILESGRGREAAQSLIYDTLWFDVFLLLIGLNLVVAVVNRIPIQRRQWPFVMTHASIVLLLLGSWISHTFGYEGLLIVYEGEEESHILLDETEVVVAWSPADGASAEVETRLPLPKGATFTGEILQREDRDRPGLRILRHIPNGQASMVLRDGGIQDAPGIAFTLAHAKGNLREWLVAGSPDSGRKDLGPFEIEFVTAPIRALFELQISPHLDTPTANLLVRLAEGGDPVRIDLLGGMGREVEVAPQVFLTPERLLLHARMIDGKLVDMPSAPANPALTATIRSPMGVESRTVFADFVAYDDIHRREHPNSAIADLQLSLNSVPLKPLVTLILGPDGELRLRVKSGLDRSLVVPLETGRMSNIAKLGIGLQVDRVLQHATPELVVDPAPEDREGARPYLLLELRRHGEVETSWLAHGATKTLELPGDRVRVAFGQRKRALPFSIALREFDLIYHPGSARPSEYRSHVQVRSTTAGTDPQDTVISMNRPLDVQGFRLFQSSYRLAEGGRPDATILSVSYDPGVPVVYTSFLLIVLGIAWYVKRSNVQPRAHSANATVAARTVPTPSGLPAAAADS